MINNDDDFERIVMEFGEYIATIRNKQMIDLTIIDFCEPILKTNEIDYDQIINISERYKNGEIIEYNSLNSLVIFSVQAYQYIQNFISNDKEIDTSTLTDQQKKECFNYSYSLISHLFPKATANLYPIRIDETSTFTMLKELSEHIEYNGGDLLPYLKYFKRYEETGQGYNVELFQVYSVIVSIGYGVKLLTGKYGTRWDTVINGVKASRVEFLRWGTVPEIVENSYQFSITYQPNKMNQYIIKLLLDMGMSRKTILNLPIQQNKKATAKEFENITLPSLPITLEA